MSSCVYMHIFPNGKRYIGVATGNVKKRWGKDGSHYSRQPAVWNAIQKYGWENIQHIIVQSGLTHEEALRMESAMISKYKTYPPSLGFGYNATSGGVERTPSLDARKKIGEKSKQNWACPEFRDKVNAARSAAPRVFTEEARKAMSERMKGEKHPFYGTHHTEEEKKHLSLVLKGKKAWNVGMKMPPEYCAKIGDIHRGKKQSPETIQKRAEKSKKMVLCVETGIVYDSQREAAKATGAMEQKISQCVLGHRKTAGGYHWKRVK